MGSATVEIRDHERRHRVGYIVGIDLGTTYSAAAVARDGRVEPFTLGVTAPVIPSVVVLREDGEILTGEAAERRAVSEPTRTGREFKRRLGDPVPMILGGTPYGAEALMAQLLRAIVSQVTEREGDPPQVIVLTHPANYSDHKKGLLEEAARLAGLDLSRVRFITEPEAAAISYARQQRVEPGEIVAVYDFGGGTFDAAVVRKTEMGFEIVGSPEGMERLGGIDVDQAVLAHVDQSVDGMLTQLDHDDAAVRSGLARLRDEARSAKEALSSDTDTTVHVAAPGLQTEVRLTREELESMIRPRVRETVAALERAVASAGISMQDVSRVLLVGGSSRIPLVSQLVREQTGRPTALDSHPKLAVATGAALAFAAEDPASGAAAVTESATPPAAPGPSAPAGPSGLQQGVTAAAVTAGMTTAGLAAGTAAESLTSASPAQAAAAAPTTGGSTAGSGAAGTVPPAPPATPTPMAAPGGKAAAAGAKGAGSKIPIIVGSVVGVAATVGAFMVARSGSDDSSAPPPAAAVTTAGQTPTTQPPPSTGTATAGSTGRGIDGIVTTIGGDGTDSGEGIPGPALAAGLGIAEEIAAAPNGDVYLIDGFYGRLLRISGGQVSEVYVADVESGETSLSGVAVDSSGTVAFGTNAGIRRLDAGGAATLLLDRREAEIGGGYSVAFGPDGTLYAASADDYRVYRIDGGTPVPFAGDGTIAVQGGAPKGEGGPALQANFAHIADIAVGPDGTLYVADNLLGRVLAISPGGTLTTVAGGGTTPVAAAADVAPEGTPANELLLDEPMSVAVTDDGTLYITDQNSHVIFRLDSDGGLEAVIADVGGVVEQEGAPANETRVGSPGDLAAGGDTLWFMSGSLLRSIDPLG